MIRETGSDTVNTQLSRLDPDPNPEMRTNASAWTVLFALLLPAAARGQDADVDTIPIRREFLDPPPEIPHDPFGFGFTNIGYTVGLKLAEVYDDNIFLTAAAEEEDLITVILLSAEGHYRREDNEANVTYRGRERIYADNSDLTGMEHFVDASGRVRVSDFQFEAGGEWKDLKDTFNPLEIPEPVDSTFGRGFLRAGVEGNKVKVSLTAELARFAVDDDLHDRGDYDQAGLALLGAVSAWTQAEAFIEVLFRSTDYDEGEFSDFSYLRIAVGARGTFSPRLRGVGRIGFGRTETEDEGTIPSDDFTGLIADVTATWDMSEKHELFGGLLYAPSESVVSGLAIHQGVHAGWRFRMNEYWAVRTSVRWSQETDASGDFERSGFWWRAGVRWDSGKTLYADAGLLMRTADADDPTLEYDNLRLSIGMGAEW